MSAEPLIQPGLREFDLQPWELREGRLMITLNSSTSSFSVGVIQYQRVRPDCSGGGCYEIARALPMEMRNMQTSKCPVTSATYSADVLLTQFAT
jgi:hypothetical protein